MWSPKKSNSFKSKSENLVGLVKIKEDINDALSVEDAKRDVVDIEESRTKWWMKLQGLLFVKRSTIVMSLRLAL